MHAPSNLLPPFGQDCPAIQAVRFGRLKAELKSATADVRALTTAAVTSGRVVVTNLPPLWANRLTGANRDKAKAARALMPSERADVANGLRTLNGRRRPLDLTTIQVGDLAAEIERDPRLANKVMLALDIATQPVAAAAE